jgi:phosphatidylinositol kinase/protein kinase (PI-3  family)
MYQRFKFFNVFSTGELNANRPVPFRLTPNIAEFLTAIGVTGPLTAAMLVTARCLAYPQYRVSSFLAAVLRDEYITWHKKVRVVDTLTPSAKVEKLFSVNAICKFMCGCMC